MTAGRPRSQGPPLTPKAARERLMYEQAPGYREAALARAAARGAAKEALARRFPAEFLALYEEALAARGYSGPAMERPCPCGGTIARRAPTGKWPLDCGCGTVVPNSRRRRRPRAA